MAENRKAGKERNENSSYTLKKHETNLDLENDKSKSQILKTLNKQSSCLRMTYKNGGKKEQSSLLATGHGRCAAAGLFHPRSSRRTKQVTSLLDMGDAENDNLRNPPDTQGTSPDPATPGYHVDDPHGTVARHTRREIRGDTHAAGPTACMLGSGNESTGWAVVAGTAPAVE